MQKGGVEAVWVFEEAPEEVGFVVIEEGRSSMWRRVVAVIRLVGVELVWNEATMSESHANRHVPMISAHNQIRLPGANSARDSCGDVIWRKRRKFATRSRPAKNFVHFEWLHGERCC